MEYRTLTEKTRAIISGYKGYIVGANERYGTYIFEPDDKTVGVQWEGGLSDYLFPGVETPERYWFLGASDFELLGSRETIEPGDVVYDGFGNQYIAEANDSENYPIGIPGMGTVTADGEQYVTEGRVIFHAPPTAEMLTKEYILPDLPEEEEEENEEPDDKITVTIQDSDGVLGIAVKGTGDYTQATAIASAIHAALRP